MILRKPGGKKKQKTFLLRFCILQSTSDVFYNSFWRWVSGAVRWHFMDPFYVLRLWHLLGRFVLSGLDFAYYVCIISSWEVFILKRHDISLKGNGADVFICWFDDCLSDITWNKTMSTRSALIRCRLLNVAGKSPLSSNLKRLHGPQSQIFLTIPQEPPTRPATQSFCRRNNPQLTKKEQYILQFSLN